MRDFLDDLKSLSKGKASRRKIGSRSIGHRLEEHDRMALNSAIRKGFVLSENVRVNVLNHYQKVCVEWRLKVILVENQQGRFVASIFNDTRLESRLSFADIESLADFAAFNRCEKSPFTQ